MQIPKLNLTGACLSRKHAPRSHSLTLVTGITKNIASVGPSSGMPERPQELSVTETLQDIDHDMTHHLQTYHSRHWPTSPGVSTGRTMTNQDAHLGRHVQWSHTIQIFVVEICTWMWRKYLLNGDKTFKQNVGCSKRELQHQAIVPVEMI